MALMQFGLAIPQGAASQMVSLGLVVLVLGMALAGFRKAHRAETWSWSKFALTLGFLAILIVIVTAPVVLMNPNGPHFFPVYVATWVVALALMVAFIFWARRWKFPNSRSSLETDRNQPPPR
jgi:hypothetical protein